MRRLQRQDAWGSCRVSAATVQQGAGPALQAKVAATSLLQHGAGEAPIKTPGKDTKQPREAKQPSLRKLHNAT